MALELDVDLSGNPRLEEFSVALDALLATYAGTLDKDGVIKVLEAQANYVRVDSETWPPFDPNAEPPAP